MNINVSDKAMEELEKLAKTKEEMKALRIYVASYGWAGPSFGLALDEQKDGDIEMKIGEFSFVVEDDLADMFDKFTVDYADTMLKKGFSVLAR